MNPKENEQQRSCTIKTCLLVDDVPMNLAVLKGLLKKAGVECTLVNSAQEALEKLQEQNYDLLMTDLWMPRMNGAQMATLIRQDPRFRDLPILAVTADPDYANNFPMGAFDGALLKPVNKEYLKEKLLAVNISLNFEIH